MSRNILFCPSLRRDVFGRSVGVEVGSGVEAREERLPRGVRHRLRLQEVQPRRKGVNHPLFIEVVGVLCISCLWEIVLGKMKVDLVVNVTASLNAGRWAIGKHANNLEIGATDDPV